MRGEGRGHPSRGGRRSRSGASAPMAGGRRARLPRPPRPLRCRHRGVRRLLDSAPAALATSSRAGLRAERRRGCSTTVPAPPPFPVHVLPEAVAHWCARAPGAALPRRLHRRPPARRGGHRGRRREVGAGQAGLVRAGAALPARDRRSGDVEVPALRLALTPVHAHQEDSTRTTGRASPPGTCMAAEIDKKADRPPRPSGR